jgi:hypothetical protein
MLRELPMKKNRKQWLLATNKRLVHLADSHVKQGKEQ